MRRNRFVAVAMAVMLIMLTAACTKSANQPQPSQGSAAKTPDAPQVQYSNTLVIAEKEHPATFDPVQAYDSTVNRMMVAGYESLVMYKRGTSEIVPALAETWEISKDGLTYTFSLRKGVKFHDGTELSADDVAYSFDRAKKLGKGVASDLANYAGSEVVDKHTVKLKLSKSYAPFFNFLPKFFILNKKLVQANEKNGDMGEAWLRDHDAGSGPYKLISFIPEKEARWEKFPDYWRGWSGNHVEKVTWLFIKESTTHRLMLEKGEVDMTDDLNVEDLPTMAKNPDFAVHEAPTVTQFYIFMNTQSGPLKNKMVRQALSHAYDYAGHIEKALAGHGVQARGPVPTTMMWHDSTLPRYDYNLEKAKKLLAEAGYPNGGFTLRFAYLPAIQEEVRAVEIFTSALKDLGITVKADGMTWPTFVSQLKSLDTLPDLSAVYAFPSYPDPNAISFTNYYSKFAGPGFNYSWYKNEALDEKILKAQSSTDPKERETLYKEIQKTLVEDAPAIFISNGTHIYTARSWVKGYKYDGAHHQSINVYDISLDKKPLK